jgi:hypothetical protein
MHHAAGGIRMLLHEGQYKLIVCIFMARSGPPTLKTNYGGLSAHHKSGG